MNLIEFITVAIMSTLFNQWNFLNRPASSAFLWVILESNPSTSSFLLSKSAHLETGSFKVGGVVTEYFPLLSSSV
jgi:hypothetical protein